MRPKKASKEQIRLAREKELRSIQELEDRAAEFYREPDESANLFSNLPISTKTLKALSKSNYVEMTEIQKKALPLALARKDVLGAAKTGSGKTLAFLIPVLEILYREKWTPLDGLGALVISPTRELALQIFNVLCKIGRTHSLSAGLVIGGKDVEEEQVRLNRMNILICTPGRLLQHMDQTVGFDCANLKLLVLDEADRILDMGFKREVNAIIENLPRRRQTLLFSATQTKSVKDLARLSLKDPEYVAVHEKSDIVTPKKLSQHYMVCELSEKLDILYSFIKSHLKCRVLVFMSSCKQVRFVYETFSRLQLGVSLLHLHGKQKQMKRVEIFEKFMKSPCAYLLCTDIAARGLDFPAVDWVVQLDCPEDTDTYIHRVGRTARYDADGKALLMLLPSELEMVKQLKEKKVPIERIHAKSSKTMSVAKQLQLFCFQDPEIKNLGQKAFRTYVRSVFLQKDKSVFDFEKLPLEAFAQALGLPGAPIIRYARKKVDKNQPWEYKALVEGQGEGGSSDEEDVEDKKGAATKPKTRVDRMFRRKNDTILADHYQKLVEHSSSGGEDDGDDSEGEFLTLKRADHALDDEDDATAEVKRDGSSSSGDEGDGNKDRTRGGKQQGGTGDDSAKRIASNPVKVITINPNTGLPVVVPNIPADQMTKRQIYKTKAKIIKNTRNTRVVFDDEGNARPVYELEDEATFRKQGPIDKLVEEHVQKNKELMEHEDVIDRALDKEKRRQKRLLKKQREREAMGETGSAPVAVLGSPEFDGSDGGDEEEEKNYYSNDDDNTDRSGKRSRDKGSSGDSDAEEGEPDETKSEAKKRRKLSKRPKVLLEVSETPSTLEDQENLALRLLGMG